MSEKKDWEIVVLPEVQAQMDANPELAACMREVFAKLRQAGAAVDSGQYATIEEAMKALGAEMTHVDLDE